MGTESPNPGATEIPVLPACATSDGVTWSVWCCYCLKWHLHGAGAGHRGAHCVRETPHAETGYSLEYAGTDAERPIYRVSRRRRS